MYDDDKDALAAEYVLGTLSADERAQAEALLSMDSGFDAAVRQWERRLGELNVMVEAVEPPPEIWEKIRVGIGVGAPSTISEPLPVVETVPQAPQAPETPPPTPPLVPPVPSGLPPAPEMWIQGPPEPPAERPPLPSTPQVEPRRIEPSADVILARRSGRKRRGRLATTFFTSAAIGAIAATVVFYLGTSRFAPWLTPLQRYVPDQVIAKYVPPEVLARLSPARIFARASTPGQSTTPATPPAKLPSGRLVAVLQQEPTAPAFLVTLDTQSRTLIVRRVAATSEKNRSYELWMISKQFPSPRSLGVVSDGEFTQRAIPANYDIETLRTAKYAVSLEPAGGSKSGVPTGPVLFTGKAIDSLPGNAPPT